MRILIIEDDKNLCDTLKFQLLQEGLLIDVCHEGPEGLHCMQQQAYDLILLDCMLPEMDGVSLLRIARAQGVMAPVIMITALGELEDKVTGLDAGADDYLVKPFAYEELMARIRSIFRRPAAWAARRELTAGDIALEPDEKRLTGPRSSCSLSRKEGELLEAFLKNPGRTLPRAVLLSRVWGPDAEVEDGNLDNYIHFLRRRLRAVGSRMILKTARGIGYSLCRPED